MHDYTKIDAIEMRDLARVREILDAQLAGVRSVGKRDTVSLYLSLERQFVDCVLANRQKLLATMAESLEVRGRLVARQSELLEGFGLNIPEPEKPSLN